MGDFWQGKRVLVTGGAGMIGSHLVWMLLETGAKVDMVDDLSRGNKDNVPWGRVGEKWFGTRLWRYRLGSNQHCGCHYGPTFLKEAFGEKDVVFHLAARVTGIGFNMANNLLMMQDNLAINHEVAEMVREYKPERYVYVSTSCVYPHDAPVPTPESVGDVCNPEPTNWGYGVAKWVGEQQAKAIHKAGISQVAILRFFNAAGPRDYYDWETSHVIPALIRRFLEGQNPVVVWGTGLQRRAFVDCRDLAMGTMLMAEKGCDGEATNIGHMLHISIGDLAYLIRDLTDSKAAIEFDASKPDGYPVRGADTTRLRKFTKGWIPWTPIEATLIAMIADYKERYPNGYLD